MDFVKPNSTPILKSLASAITEILNGYPKFWGAPLSGGHAHFLLLTGWSSHGGLSFGSLAATVIQMVFLVGR